MPGVSGQTLMARITKTPQASPTLRSRTSANGGLAQSEGLRRRERGSQATRSTRTGLLHSVLLALAPGLRPSEDLLLVPKRRPSVGPKLPGSVEFLTVLALLGHRGAELLLGDPHERSGLRGRQHRTNISPSAEGLCRIVHAGGCLRGRRIALRDSPSRECALLSMIDRADRSRDRMHSPPPAVCPNSPA